jgi:hypothetical protein
LFEPAHNTTSASHFLERKRIQIESPPETDPDEEPLEKVCEQLLEALEESALRWALVGSLGLWMLALFLKMTGKRKNN